MQTTHLDLGCGKTPRNPYGHETLYGIDILAHSQETDFSYVQANIFSEALPFANNFFNSVSAYDFIEHIPRVCIADDNKITNPFIDVMNEIYRVLKPRGRLYAVTPCFPHNSVFSDPTHVNPVTLNTHSYFCGASPQARSYGFAGEFKVIKAELCVSHYVQLACSLTLKQRLKTTLRRLRGRLSHVLWELEAVKK